MGAKSRLVGLGSCSRVDLHLAGILSGFREGEDDLQSAHCTTVAVTPVTTAFVWSQLRSHSEDQESCCFPAFSMMQAQDWLFCVLP